MSRFPRRLSFTIYPALECFPDVAGPITQMTCTIFDVEVSCQLSEDAVYREFSMQNQYIEYTEDGIAELKKSLQSIADGYNYQRQAERARQFRMSETHELDAIMYWFRGWILGGINRPEPPVASALERRYPTLADLQIQSYISEDEMSSIMSNSERQAEEEVLWWKIPGTRDIRRLQDGGCVWWRDVLNGWEGLYEESDPHWAERLTRTMRMEVSRTYATLGQMDTQLWRHELPPLVDHEESVVMPGKSKGVAGYMQCNESFKKLIEGLTDLNRWTPQA